MKIIRIEKTCRPLHGQYCEIAKFDVELTADVRLFAVRLLERPNGHRIVQGAVMAGGRSATFSPELAKALTALASNSLYTLKGDMPDALNAA